MADNLVGYSRAGDAFHYRWAARRSLKLIYPNSPLSLIVIEASKEDNIKGEYVIVYIMEMLTTLFRAKLTTGLADFWVAANAIKACTKIVI